MKLAMCDFVKFLRVLNHSLHILSSATSEQPVCFEVGQAVILCRNPMAAYIYIYFGIFFSF